MTEMLEAMLTLLLERIGRGATINYAFIDGERSIHVDSEPITDDGGTNGPYRIDVDGDAVHVVNFRYRHRPHVSFSLGDPDLIDGLVRALDHANHRSWT